MGLSPTQRKNMKQLGMLQTNKLSLKDTTTVQGAKMQME